ncbi:TPA: hypothetical protein ACYSCZ_002907 [Klebsiella oxytoca]
MTTEFFPPLGSSSPAVLDINSKNLDNLMNGPEEKYQGRGGQFLDSWAGMMARYAAALKAMQESGGVAIYDDESTLRASTPVDTYALAVDRSTGSYYFWDTSEVSRQDETTAILARMTKQPTDIQLSAINRLYFDLKQAGLLGKLDALWLGINTCYTDSKLNFILDKYNLSSESDISYSTAAGWRFSGSNWLDTRFNPSVSAGNFVQDSASFGVIVAGAENSGSFMGAYDGSTGLTLSRSGNTLSARINDSELISASAVISQTSLFSVVRTTNTKCYLYCGDYAVTFGDVLSETPVNASVSIGRSSSTENWYTGATICAAYLGAGLDNSEIFYLNDCLKRYMFSFRAATQENGVWVKLQYSLMSPQDVQKTSEFIVQENTGLLNKALISCPTYADMALTVIDSDSVRAVDESTGIIYEPETLPATINQETTDLIARMTTKPNTTQTNAINQLIYLLKNSGVWDSLDCLYLGINTSYSDSLLNFKEDKYNLTTTAAPKWSQSGGWTFTRSTVTYLDTGFNPSMAAGKFALENASFGALLFPPSGMTATGHIMGAYNGTDGMALAPRPSQSNASMSVRLNQSSAYIPGEYPVANAIYAVSRKDGELSVYSEGLLLGATTRAATTITSENVLLGCSQKSANYHMYDGALAAAWVGASLTSEQVTTLTSAIRRYNDVFRGRLPAGSVWWSPTERRMYSHAEIVAIASSTTSGSALEPPEKTATVSAAISLALSEQGQTYRGGYIEIQPDSFIGGTEPATDSTTALWGFPQSLTASEQSRVRSMMFPGNGYGIYYIRLPLGFAYRGFRNIDATTGLAKNIGERYPGQNAALKRLMANIVEGGGGLAPEYWCPAPYWMTNGKYAGTPTSYNQPWAGGSYPRKTTLDSIKGGDPEQYAAQIEAMASAMLDDFEYLHKNVGPVRMYGLQNEPQYGHELYGTCKYTDRVYSDLLAVLQPKIAASAILSEWDGQANTPLLHVASDNEWTIGQTYIDAHAETIWGYSHHNITAIATDADWLKSSTFLTKKGNKSNVFVNETEYMHPENSSPAWRCANNMLRDLHNLTFGGAEVVMPIIHLCKQLGESSSYTSNTDGYAIMKCNLQEGYGIAPGASANTEMLGYGSFGENAWNYNAYRLIADNLTVGAIRVGGLPAISTAGIGLAAFMAGGKLKLFVVNRNNGVAAITVSLGAVKTLAGRHYDLTHAGDHLTEKSGDTLTFTLPAYSGQCWAEV